MGNGILYRGIDNGREVKKVDEYHPTLFVKSSKKTEYQTLDGIHVEEIKPGNISECRDFVTRYQGVPNFTIYGNTDYVYQYIGDNFTGEVSYDISQVPIAYIDIETTCEKGFPQVDDPKEQIIAITVAMGDETNVFCLGEYVNKFHKTYSYRCDTEEELLEQFLIWWESNTPHIVTGWNIKLFDIPYLISRIQRVLKVKDANRLSPWKRIREKFVEIQSRKKIVFQILGVSILDYYDVYRTFTYTNQESYRLDHIAFVELGERKLAYDEYDSIKEFYKNDFQKFVEYNIRDVQLVQKLEDKLKLIELSMALAYAAKVNFEDVFSQVRTWDAIIYHFLREKGIVIPPKRGGNKDDQYSGAYVKDPIVGQHDWIVSFDLNSLYPHLIMQYNISPETIVREHDNLSFGIGVNNILEQSTTTNSSKCYANLQKLKDLNLCVAANGTFYRKDIHGFLPELMEKMYEERKMYKKKMIECEKQRQEIPKMNMPTIGKAGLAQKLDNDIAKYNNFQLVRKIQLNSAYGAIGNQYFRYYDVELAEAITHSGQLSIRWIADKLNAFLNKHVGTEDYDYVVASDTDSVYLRLGKLVDRFVPNKSTSEVVDFLDKASEKIIQPFIDKQYEELASIMNAYENKMKMGREVIANNGIWTAKKRYMLNVWDSEGIRYETPKLKIMGIETTRSSTPQIVRDKLKECIRLILTTDEYTLQKYIKEFKTEFFASEPEAIAFPRGVSNLRKYTSSTDIYTKGTPVAVKGALIYNHFLEKLDLTRKYETVFEGDKIKFIYLKAPNPIGGPRGDQVISFKTMIPKELGLDNFIDYDKQFRTSFLEPLGNILTVIGWETEKTSTLEDVFG
jgi:DNA polymerase elongation subunit (family B)